MINQQNRVMLITNKGNEIYNRFLKYCIIKNLNRIDKLGGICVFKSNKYKLSACLYYSYYVVLHLIDENLERKVR